MIERCTTGDIILVGGHYYGRIEICIGGVWDTICRDSFWDNNDASVICRQLGFSPYGTPFYIRNYVSFVYTRCACMLTLSFNFGICIIYLYAIYKVSGTNTIIYCLCTLYFTQVLLLYPQIGILI